VQAAVSEILDPANGTVLLAVNEQEIAAGGGGDACQLTATVAAAPVLVELLPVTAYIWLPTVDDVATQVVVELVHPAHE
jgi:hypothetical protein